VWVPLHCLRLNGEDRSVASCTGRELVSGESGSNSLELHAPTFRTTPYRYQKSSRTASHVKKSFATRRVAAPVLSMVRHSTAS